MKYFTKELWKCLNSYDKEVRQIAEAEWKKRDDEYNERFQHVQKALPHKFLKDFFKRKGFHDYNITEVSLRNCGAHHSCRINLTDGEENLDLILEKIGSIHIEIDTFENCILGEMKWGYSEFDICNDGYIKLSILCDFLNEFEFTCKKIYFKQTKT